MAGETYVLDRPDVIPVDAVSDAFPPSERRTHRIFRVEHCARFRRVEPVGTSNDTNAT
jgi:hypothetical protein